MDVGDRRPTASLAARPEGRDGGPTSVRCAGRPVVTPFARLARTHALMAAGDAVDRHRPGRLAVLRHQPGRRPHARWRSTCCSRCCRSRSWRRSSARPSTASAGGRRVIVVACASGKVVVSIFMITHLDGLLLFPLAFVTLVLSKAYAVCKSALVPSRGAQRRASWSRPTPSSALIAGIVGFVAAVPALDPPAHQPARPRWRSRRCIFGLAPCIGAGSSRSGS